MKSSEYPYPYANQEKLIRVFSLSILDDLPETSVQLEFARAMHDDDRLDNGLIFVKELADWQRKILSKIEPFQLVFEDHPVYNDPVNLMDGYFKDSMGAVQGVSSMVWWNHPSNRHMRTSIVVPVSLLSIHLISE